MRPRTPPAGFMPSRGRGKRYQRVMRLSCRHRFPGRTAPKHCAQPGTKRTRGGFPAPTVQRCNMRKLVVLGAALALLAGPAFAQQGPPAAKGPQNNAVNTSNTPTPAAPVQGSNSFTEGEAKSRIEAKGFTN